MILKASARKCYWLNRFIFKVLCSFGIAVWGRRFSCICVGFISFHRQTCPCIFFWGLRLGSSWIFLFSCWFCFIFFSLHHLKNFPFWPFRHLFWDWFMLITLKVLPSFFFIIFFFPFRVNLGIWMVLFYQAFFMEVRWVEDWISA
jgi:hypothetical protein